MLYMAGGGRISRVHGPFVSDEEVERIVNHLKMQGAPDYLEAVTTDDDEGMRAMATTAPSSTRAPSAREPADLYDKAVQVVLRDKKASTSYIQRRLQIGYNRAASLIERWSGRASSGRQPCGQARDPGTGGGGLTGLPPRNRPNASLSPLTP